MTVAYRSFLVRAWSCGWQTVRVLVEEVQSGRRFELRGEDAARLVAEVEASLAGRSSALQPATGCGPETAPRPDIEKRREPADASVAPSDRRTDRR